MSSKSVLRIFCFSLVIAGIGTWLFMAIGMLACCVLLAPVIALFAGMEQAHAFMNAVMAVKFSDFELVFWIFLGVSLFWSIRNK